MPRTRVLAVALKAPYALSLASFAAMLIAITVVNPPAYAWDFRAFYDAGIAYLHLHSPYVSGSLAQLTTQRNFVYPLPFAALFAPISLMPYAVAAALFVVGGAALLIAAVWLLDVRDWRVYAAVAIGMPTATAIGLGTISPLLAFLLAVLWRFRDRDRIAAPALAALVLAKLFLWPVALWLLLTRRFRAVASAALLSAAAVLVASLPLGLGTLTHYAALLRSLSGIEGPTSFSLMSLGEALTGSSSVGTGVMVTAGIVALYAVARAAVAREDEQAFRRSIVAALALSPILWNHYLVLLVVPLALMRPRFSPVWLAGAWVLGVEVVERRSMLIAAAGVWIVILIQSGIVADVAERIRLGRVHPLRKVLPLLASTCLWAVLLWLIGAVTAAVPGLAALTPPALVNSPSGTATLRVIKARNEICWDIRTSGLPPVTRVEIVEAGRHRALVERPMHRGRSVGCGYYGTGARENLASTYRRGQIQLLMRVTSTGGDLLLSGRIAPKLDQVHVPSPAAS